MITPENSIEESLLKTLRELLGLTQQQFADLIGVAVSTVSRWERGKSNPSFTPGQWRRLLRKMAEFDLNAENLPDDLTPGNHLILFREG
jgi:transcriptional regulator with XRE-family HTH domain